MVDLRQVPGHFDTAALFDVVEAQLAERAMTLSALARRLDWMSKDTLERMRVVGGAAGCHHTLPVIQWVGRTPESFTVGGDDIAGELLPDPAPGAWRWYWNITELFTEMDARRAERELSWKQVAEELGSSTAEIKSLERSKYGTSISFAMRIARWLDRSAASFLWEHDGRGLPWSGRRVS